MAVYDIAGLKVAMNPKGETLRARGEKYLAKRQNDEEDCDIKIDLDPEKIIKCQHIYGHYDYDSSEYHWGGYEFFKSIIDFDGIFFHSSAIAFNNKAYLFSAPKGTGKSTHTGLWGKFFGEDKVTFINDDKPVIRLINGVFCACGSPFSGKNDISSNVTVPIGGICFLERGAENSIRPISANKALTLFFKEVMISEKQNFLEKTVALCDKLISEIPMYILKCTVSEEAVKTAYETMCK